MINKKDRDDNEFNKIYNEKSHRRHLLVWKLVATLINIPFRFMLNYSYEIPDFSNIPEPVLVVPNHTNVLDIFLIALAFHKHHVYFVGTENIVRAPVFGPIIMYLTGPITRKKGATDLGVIKTILNQIKAGHNVCIFAEGELSWDGVTGPIYPGTAKLIKLSKATLITYRIEGAYLSLPRWAKSPKRGRINGKVAGIYTPEELANMTPAMIHEQMTKDLHFDIWDWQTSQPNGPIEFKRHGIGGMKNHAKGLEKLLFMCPECRNFSTLKTSRDLIYCDCNDGGHKVCRFKARYLKTGFIKPEIYKGKEDISTLKSWDRLQRETLAGRVDSLMESGGIDEILFSDGSVSLIRVYGDHKEEVIGEGRLSLSFNNGKAMLTAGGRTFKMSEITDMALIRSKLILFSVGKEYYQITADNTNIRKYLLVWQQVH